MQFKSGINEQNILRAKDSGFQIMQTIMDSRAANHFPAFQTFIQYAEDTTTEENIFTNKKITGKSLVKYRKLCV